MSDMIERMARAICIGIGDDPDREGEVRVTGYDNAARLALSAITQCETGELVGEFARLLEEESKATALEKIDVYIPRLAIAAPKMFTTILAQQAELERVRGRGQFLSERLRDLSWDEGHDTGRDFFGHVLPALERFEAALTEQKGK